METSDVLLINPRRRRASGAKRRRNPTAAQRRARAKFAAMARARSTMANPRRRRRSRRRNPINTSAVSSYSRRVRSRSRNPINTSGIVNSIREGAIQAAGAVAMDVGYAQIARFLPANLQAGPGQITAGTALKMVLTAAAGQLLSRATQGMSKKAAIGALTVQARDVILGLLPAGLVPGVGGGAVAGRLGYGVPAPTVNYSGRVGPSRTAIGAYAPGVPSPLLSAYGRPGGPTPLLSGRRAVRATGRGHY